MIGVRVRMIWMIIIMTLAVVMTIGGSNCDGIYEGWLALARLLIF
jgi:hypothetical protein